MPLPHAMTGQITSDALLSAVEGLAWIVDRDGVIVAVGSTPWNAFPGNQQAKAEQVLGRQFLTCITGGEIQAVYRRFVEAVISRRTHRISFNYRCDAPAIERHMKLTISPVLVGGDVAAVLFHSQVMQENERPPIDLFDPDVMMRSLKANTALPFITMCGFCQKIAWNGQGDAEWIEAEDYYRRGGSSKVCISHGICPACKAEVVGQHGDGPGAAPK